MTVQHIVDPGDIESQLIRIWEVFAKGKMRACLFNLIVFNRISARTNYFRDIVQKVSEKYPCRVLFISSDPEAHVPYLKTAVSVVGSGSIACDYIDIGVAGEDLQKIPPLCRPHMIPDLPITLLWTEDPSKHHPLFKPLAKIATRVIFDSESADNLFAFSETVLQLREEMGIDTADLNWARTEGWRDLIASLFHSDKSISMKEINITYNARETEFFCHLQVQSLYLLSWISSRLNWKFKKSAKSLQFTFEKQKGHIQSTTWEQLGAGTIISVDIRTKAQHYQCARIPTQYHRVTIQISNREKCELPYQFVLGKTATGQSLVKEIIAKGTSAHYLAMLNNLNTFDK